MSRASATRPSRVRDRRGVRQFVKLGLVLGGVSLAVAIALKVRRSADAESKSTEPRRTGVPPHPRHIRAHHQPPRPGRSCSTANSRPTENSKPHVRRSTPAHGQIRETNPIPKNVRRSQIGGIGSHPRVERDDYQVRWGCLPAPTRPDSQGEGSKTEVVSRAAQTATYVLSRRG